MGVARDGVLEVALGIVEAAAFEDLVEQGGCDWVDSGMTSLECELL